jgi:hypothetical protein
MLGLDPLVGQIVDWHGELIQVLAIYGEYDDDATCVYVDGPYTGLQTARDTFTLRRLARSQGIPC